MKIRLFVIVIILSTHTLYSSNVKFYDINTIYGINLREVASICEDKNGFIWASSKTGILRLSEDTYHIYQLPYETADVINVKLIYENDILIAFTNNGQIFRYNVLSDKFELVIDIRNGLNNSNLWLNGVFVYKSDSLLIASSVGLYKFCEGNISRIGREYFSDVQIERFSNDHLFILGEKSIYLMNVNTKEIKCLYEFSEQFSLRVTSHYYDDTEKQLWLGTISDGLYFYDLKNDFFSPAPFKTFPKQPIQAITLNSDSTILIGIDGQGIWELTRTGDKVLNIFKEDIDNPLSLKGDGVYDILCDANSRVWVCTYTGGLLYFDQAHSDITQIIHQVNNHNSLNNNNVNKVIEDNKGDLWFATNNGISHWNTTSGKWTTYFADNQEQTQVFLSLCEDNNGNIWAGTYSSGLYVIDGKSGKEIAHYSSEEDKSSLTNDFIFDIFKDSQGDLWLGGTLGGTFCYVEKENKFKTYPFHAVYSFAELKPGYILLACTNGLFLLDKQTAETAVLLSGYLLCDLFVLGDDIWLATSGDGLIKYNLNDKTSEKFTMETGLPSNYINSILYEDNYLWLGTENGLCRFNPVNKSAIIFSSIWPVLNASINRNSSFKLKDGQLIWGTSNGAVIFHPDVVKPSKLEGCIFFQDLIISGRSVRDSLSVKLDTPLDSLQRISLDYNQNTLTLEFLAIGTGAANSKFSWKMEGIDSEWSQPTSSRILTYASIPSGHFTLKIRMYDGSLSQLVNERSLKIYITPPFWKTWWFLLIIFTFIAAVIIVILRNFIARLEQQHIEDKIRFFTNTAHDMRTSLTLITAPIEELNKEMYLSDKGRYYLSLATEQSSRLSFVTTQLLDFQKVDAGKGQLFLIMTDVVDLVHRRKSMFAATAKKQQIDLLFTTNQASYVTALDELKIEKVVDNIISNAIKYSYSKGKVEISVNCEKDKWTLEVKDYGIGISDKGQSKLFREFYRGDNVVNSKIVGSGIGLLLVKKYVSMHNGDLYLYSKENIGSTFKIVIPYRDVSNISQSIAPLRPELISATQGDANEISILEKKDDVREKKEHVLVVEDNYDLQNFLKYALQSHYQVTVASDGADAWKQVQKQLPDLVISDIMMPNMDGFELCRLMKSTYETSHIPVVLLTALSEKAEQLQGLGVGADDYLTKPFDMELLTQRVKSIIQNRKIVREKALKFIREMDNEPIFLNELNDKFVKEAVEAVRINMANPEFDKEAFASAMNVSPSLLYKKLKSLTDQSPIDFIKGIRLNYAVELLQSGNFTITEVSELCGFSTAKYFSHVFKQYFGEPPSKI